MARRPQFSLHTALVLVFVIALVTWPSSVWIRHYLANRGLVPVKGSVVFKGQPLKDAQVVLIPAQAGGKPLQGRTDARGDYEMDRLVAPGEYTVTITEVGSAKRGLSPKYASATMSGLTVFVAAKGPNHFVFQLTD
ncbi:MAG TPA: carboxypeptidase-like regulatory domain-containing protein [Pirellulales bacterium]|nr:carboxypeptidase-like regulatory domain-containing protein [Pirellulales bacterium]